MSKCLEHFRACGSENFSHKLVVIPPSILKLVLVVMPLSKVHFEQLFRGVAIDRQKTHNSVGSVVMRRLKCRSDHSSYFFLKSRCEYFVHQVTKLDHKLRTYFLCLVLEVYEH